MAKQTDHSIDGIVDFVRALPEHDQLAFLRRVVPGILGKMGDEPRNALVAELNYAIAQSALAGSR